jgi:hypothetical protein
MATPTRIRWRAVSTAAGLALAFDVVLLLFGVGAAADRAGQFPLLTRPAPSTVTTVRRPITARFERRDTRSAEELAAQLFAAPEIDLDAARGTAAGLADATRRGNSRFTEPILDPLLARADLQGLPLTMGDDCRLGKDSALTLQFQSRELRRLLSQCAVGDAPDAVLLRPRLLLEDDNGWHREESVPVLVQMLQAENQPVRRLLVELLDRTPGRRASAALAGRAVFDLSAEVREAAVRALARRPRDDYFGLLLDALRYPWAPAADHAAEALVALDDRESVPRLRALLAEPDPAAPATRPFSDIDPALLRHAPWPPDAWPPTAVVLDDAQGGRPRMSPLGRPDDIPERARARGGVSVVREVVRVNHLRNCLLCHAAAAGPPTYAIVAPVPSPDRPLPPVFSNAYYEARSGMAVRADVTYLRQDFSVPQPVEDPGQWPTNQRYDYMVRTRYATAEELRRPMPPTYPQREAVRWALRQFGVKEGRDNPR